MFNINWEILEKICITSYIWRWRVVLKNADIVIDILHLGKSLLSTTKGQCVWCSFCPISYSLVFIKKIWWIDSFDLYLTKSQTSDWMFTVNDWQKVLLSSTIISGCEMRAYYMKLMITNFMLSMFYHIFKHFDKCVYWLGPLDGNAERCTICFLTYSSEWVII